MKPGSMMNLVRVMVSVTVRVDEKVDGQGYVQGESEGIHRIELAPVRLALWAGDR